MDAKTKEHLYEPFFTTKKAGTGLGLSTVYGIVKQHKGHISLKTKLKQGTTFTIFLPEVEQESKTIKKSDLKMPNTKGNEHILLVEDEDSVRELVKELLSEQGYNVSTARNGQEGIEKFKARFDLVITDVIMPKVSGFQLVEKILKEKSGIKVIIMSGCTQELKIPENLKQDSILFMSKPFSSEEFLGKVRSVLDQDEKHNSILETANL